MEIKACLWTVIFPQQGSPGNCLFVINGSNLYKKLTDLPFKRWAYNVRDITRTSTDQTKKDIFPLNNYWIKVTLASLKHNGK